MIRFNAGDKYGRLTIIAPAPPSDRYPKKRMWTCRCDCGNIVDYPASYIKNGVVTSCGCGRNAPRVDATGQRYGRLVALAPTGEIIRHSAVWRWKCDCGNIVDARLDTVRDCNKRSCGCMEAEAKQFQAAEMRKKLTLVYDTNVGLLRHDGANKNSSSGHRNVCWHKGCGKWRVCICFRKKRYNIGYFDDYEKACAAADDAREHLHKGFLEWYDQNHK